MAPKQHKERWPNDLLTIQEVADYLRVSRATIWRWCKKGMLPSFQIGRNWRISREDFLALEASLSQLDILSDNVAQTTPLNSDDDSFSANKHVP